MPETLLELQLWLKSNDYFEMLENWNNIVKEQINKENAAI
jgi:hypothetical protein